MQPMQFRHVSLFSRVYRALRQPVAQHNRRIHALHLLLAQRVIHRLCAQSRPVAIEPGIERRAIDKRIPQRRGSALLLRMA